MSDNFVLLLLLAVCSVMFALAPPVGLLLAATISYFKWYFWITTPRERDE